jgi:hypothetical protein
MCDAQGLDDLEDGRAAEDVAGRVLAMGVVGLDVEFGVVARLGGQGRPQPREQRSARGRGGWIGGSALLTGTHTLCTAHIMRLRARGCSVTRRRPGAAGGERTQAGTRAWRTRGTVVASVSQGRRDAGVVEGTAHWARAGWGTRRGRQAVSAGGAGERRLSVSMAESFTTDRLRSGYVRLLRAGTMVDG